MIHQVCCNKCFLLSYFWCKEHGAFNYPIDMPPPVVPENIDEIEKVKRNDELNKALDRLVELIRRN